MARPVLFSLEDALPLTEPIQQGIGAEQGALEIRRFPDGESYLRVMSAVSDRDCILLVNLAQPDDKILPLLFLAEALRSRGAKRVGLVAPYLSYMRQDKAFQPGEIVTSGIFARLLSSAVDWLVTVDPHLHRYHSLAEIYRIPALAISGTPALQNWIVTQPGALLLVGPDAESRQWVESLARETGQPFIVGDKERYGDRDVRVSLPQDRRIANATAVIVDDIVASGHTVLQSIAALKSAGASRIVCAAVHGVFAENADRKILHAGADQLAVSNSIPGKHCAFDLSPLLLPAIEKLLANRNPTENPHGGGHR
ncbi:ribose-phosphate diphosphokinase [uncultured Microbulbifer sp.]|uniref:ribose-phosphate diphosphokinase n=1 Tax=uncultured Microbulbifer sp. TaxID=348147 RepID=UPI0025CFB2D8|nr:ribose-phosphate diphosphokinase [uncultured Microbulbifer sp.]